MEQYLKRTWAEVSLDAIDHNFQVIREAVKPGTRICCVVKADCYGHGAERLAQEYASLGADWFAVSNLEEALQIRKAGVKEKPILILGYTPANSAKLLAENNVATAVLSAEYAQELSEEAVRAGVTVRAHIKVDTGMSRIGFLYQNPEKDEASIDAIERACRLPGLNAEGIFTHFAVADEGENGSAFTRRQFSNLTGAIERLKERGITFAIRHCANSAAIFDYPEMQLDMVRPGVILYGLMPSSQTVKRPPFVPAMELKSVVSLVKTLPPEASISYGRTFRAGKPTTVATVPIGYADGFPRRLSQKAEFLIHGKRARILGRVCMDQLMLDVTGIPDVQPGDPVTVFGHNEDAFLPVEELAALNETINYEVVCDLSKRVPRVYLKGGKEVGTLDYLLR
jgi:alanine racemase